MEYLLWIGLLILSCRFFYLLGQNKMFEEIIDALNFNRTKTVSEILTILERR